MKPFMITTPRGKRNWTPAGGYDHPKNKSITASCASMELSFNLNTCDFVIGKDDNQNIKIILTKKKAA
tara:strand:- start:533 stop:736 length:204 start_codon:yes stop_codon:yes gene_type:complete